MIRSSLLLPAGAGVPEAVLEIEAPTPASGVEFAVLDNPVGLTDHRFRVDDEPWSNVLALPLSGRQTEPLTPAQLDFRIEVDLRWDDAFAETRSCGLRIEPWKAIPIPSPASPDVVVTANWTMLTSWIHDPRVMLGHFLVSAEADVSGDLWFLSMVEAVVSSTVVSPESVRLLMELRRLELEARRW
jgi:hypothetical protein